MKSVLISIQPKWCELIASGKKTVEVRKTKPKLETPFKVYIYCTYGQGLIENNDLCYPNMLLDQKVSKNAIWGNCCNGKVIGEFVCDEIDRLAHCGTCNNDIRLRIEKNLYYKELDFSYLNKCQLSYADIDEYSKGGDVYGWHISNLVIYDKPRELSEFKTPPCERPESACGNCKYLEVTNTPNAYEVECYRENGVHLTRPPQSWCYVESEGGSNETR